MTLYIWISLRLKNRVLQGRSKLFSLRVYFLNSSLVQLVHQYWYKINRWWTSYKVNVYGEYSFFECTFRYFVFLYYIMRHIYSYYLKTLNSLWFRMNIYSGKFSSTSTCCTFKTAIIKLQYLLVSKYVSKYALTVKYWLDFKEITFPSELYNSHPQKIFF